MMPPSGVESHRRIDRNSLCHTAVIEAPFPMWQVINFNSSIIFQEVCSFCGLHTMAGPVSPIFTNLVFCIVLSWKRITISFSGIVVWKEVSNTTTLVISGNNFKGTDPSSVGRVVQWGQQRKFPQPFE